ncbi:hypothetical protein HPB50_012335 [Hyalomma asiaticum]|uniref:Uncharacterized protein n=1 Tax=Hyalomma asiaticum TaxID=266040 RepID=A0ACB7TLJ2_HYAAI|nr:hypothetical protein HPB50_012335 [Hyalomma asiaticum]
MDCTPATSTSTGERYFFSLWPYGDRAYLRALYKKFACPKVHLMAAIMKSAPADRWDCGHWRMWGNMAGKVCSVLGYRVSPKKLESFFWDVIAQGTDVDEVNERLDKLIYGASGACSAGDESSGAPGKATERRQKPRRARITMRASARRESNDTERAATCTPSPSAPPEDQARLLSERAASSESVKVRRISFVSDSDVASLPELLPSHVSSVADTFEPREAFEQDAPSSDEQRVDDPARCDIDDATASRGSMRPDAQVYHDVNRETAKHADQAVQCSPASADKALQCDVGPSGVADMMRREHLLRMEVLQLRMEVLMKTPGPPPP